MHRTLRSLAPAFALAMFIGALWLLRHELKHYHYRDIREHLLSIAPARIAAAAALTILNYLVLVGYDYIAVRYLRHPLSLGRIALASFIGHVTSANFGAVLGGTSVRYRLYSTWGLSAAEIFKLVALSTVTFWFGFFALAGVLFIVAPLEIPATLHMPFATSAPLGGLLLAIAAGYLLLTAIRKRPLAWRQWEFPLPPFTLSLAQLAVASLDLVVAAGVLYMLLPPSVEVSFVRFLGVYLLAVVAVLFTHVPGGLGVLELVILRLLEPTQPDAVLGSLLVFRVVYYLVPLGFASLMLAGHEALLQRRGLERVGEAIGRWGPAIAPRMLALLMLLAGAMLVFSGAVPAPRGRLAWLHDFVPLGVIEASHFLGSICGVVLLVLARGLQRRLDSAYLLTAATLAAGIVFSLLRGFDYVEAIVLALLLAVLLPCRRHFYRRAALFGERFTPEWIATVTAVIACSFWLALFSHRHAEFSGELWWQFALHGDAPRALRASVGAAGGVLLVGLLRLFRFSAPRPHAATAVDLDRAAQIVSDWPKASANLALLGDKYLLFNDDRTGFLMYGVERRSWVALGDPVAPAESQAELVWRFRELAENHGGWSVFYQIAQDRLPLYLDAGLTLLKLGEEARVPLASFTLEGPARGDMRRARARAERDGCRFEVLMPEAVGDVLPTLAEISDQWLAQKNTREKGFSLGYFDADYVRRFPIAIVRRGDRIEAFANVWRGRPGSEIAADLIRYRPDAPSGMMDYLFTELMLWGRDQGFGWFSLGMAPLAGLDERTTSGRWNWLGGIVFRHGEHFYNFQGLREYKDKFDPEWTPKYLATPAGLTLPLVLANVATLISGSMRGMLRK